MRNLKSIIKIFMAIELLLAPTLGYTQNMPTLSGTEDTYQSRISEYFYNKSGREILKPVELMGGVAKPGLYHIPAGTSLTRLLSISGGPTPDAEVSEIVIRLADGKNVESDLPNIMKTGKEVPLSGGEIIYVPRKEGLINQETGYSITVIASVVSLFLTAYLVYDNSRK